MIKRNLNLRQKDIILINDIPVKSEVLEGGEIFGAISNLNLLNSLKTGKVGRNSIVPATHKGIFSTRIHCTYLDYSPFKEGNFDFIKEIRRKETLEFHEEENFLSVPFIKGWVISKRLYTCIQELIEEIRKVNPKLIIVTGKWAFFFLSGLSSVAENMPSGGKQKPLGCILKYRGSILQPAFHWDLPKSILFPIIHPVHSFGMQDKVQIMEVDIQKLGWIYQVLQTKEIDFFLKPPFNFIIGDKKNIVIDYLDKLLEVLEKKPTKVSIDTETVFNATIDCMALCYRENEALCLPFASALKSCIFSIEDEIEILFKLKEVMIHKNCLHVGQNYDYDCQYFKKLWMLDIIPTYDIMVMHHLLHNAYPKKLAFLASLYCDFYTYWKDERTLNLYTPEERWRYCGKDTIYPLQILEVLLQDIENSPIEGLKELVDFQLKELYPELIKTMNKGIKINLELKKEYFDFFSSILKEVPNKLNDMLGFEFNANSYPQKKKLLKDFFGIKLKTSIKKSVDGKVSTETCDAKAILEYCESYPLVKPFLMCLLEYSALNKFTNTFLGAKVDEDNRMRTQYNITGTAFGRLSSTKNVWGRGANYQNLPEKGKVNLKYLLDLVGLKEVEKEETDTNFLLSFEENIEE